MAALLHRRRAKGWGRVAADLLGTTDHEGKQLVTYNGHPLYYYVEEGPNEVLCQGVDEFGGLWQVVSPSGSPIQ